MFVRSMISFDVPCLLFSLGKVFGRLRLRCMSLFFVWSAAWEKLLTGDILWCRGFDFVDWCILCQSNGESANHLLLHCGKAFQLWSLVFRSFGISWVLLDRLQTRFSAGGTGSENTLLEFGI